MQGHWTQLLRDQWVLVRSIVTQTASRIQHYAATSYDRWDCILTSLQVDIIIYTLTWGHQHRLPSLWKDPVIIYTLTWGYQHRLPSLWKDPVIIYTLTCGYEHRIPSLWKDPVIIYTLTWGYEHRLPSLWKDPVTIYADGIISRRNNSIVSFSYK